MQHSLCYPETNDVRNVKRRIRYIIRKAREYGIELE
jgi:hypothetical protein